MPVRSMQRHGLIVLASALSILRRMYRRPNYAHGLPHRRRPPTKSRRLEGRAWVDEMKRGKWWRYSGMSKSLQEQVVISIKWLLAESNSVMRALVQESRSAYYPTASVGWE